MSSYLVYSTFCRGVPVDDIAASEDILGEIILYNTLWGNIFVYYIMSALYFILFYIEKIQVRSALFRGPGLV